MPRPASLSMAVTAVVLLAVPLAARPHCDTLDGPVVKTARAALDAKDLRPVLAWVKPANEQEIRAAFFAALQARMRSPTSSDTSDRRFYEAVVRVHRAGEGAPYTGLGAAGEGVGPAVLAADRALVTGDLGEVEHRLATAIRSGLHRKYEALEALPPPGHDVAAGRAWVAAYVEYVHHVERIEAAAAGAGAHPGVGPEGAVAPGTVSHAH